MDRRGLVGVDVDVNVGLIPLFVWMLYGVVEVFREGVDEGVEAIRVRFITVVSNAVVYVVAVGVGRVVVGFQCSGFNFCDTNFRKDNDQGQVFSAISAISHNLPFTAQNRTTSIFPATFHTIGLTSH